MNPKKALDQKKADILASAARHGARSVRVFGSVARGEARDDSDLDLLVEMEEGRTLLDLIGLHQDLTDLLPCEVEVVTEADLSRHYRPRVLQEAVAL